MFRFALSRISLVQHSNAVDMIELNLHFNIFKRHCPNHVSNPVSASFADDCISQNETRLNGSSGFLALFERASNSTHYQIKTSCPWVIQVNKGQRINVTWQVSPSIHSFSVDDGSSDNMNEDDSMEFDDDAEFSFDQDQRLSTTDRISCPLQITFVEISSFPVTHIICRNETKEPRIVYLSKTNRLEIKVASLLVPHEVLTSEFDSSSKRKHGREHTSVKSKRTSLWKPHVLHYKGMKCFQELSIKFKSSYSFENFFCCKDNTLLLKIGNLK